MELSFNFVLCNVEDSAAASRGAISIAGKSDAVLQKFFSSHLGHTWLVVSIHITCDKYWTGATHGVVTLRLESGLVDCVDLVSFVWVPARANEGSTQGVPVVENDFPHYGGSWLHWWEVAKLSSLNINVVSHVLANSACVGGGSWSLSVNSLVNWLKFVWAFVSNEHRL